MSTFDPTEYCGTLLRTHRGTQVAAQFDVLLALVDFEPAAFALLDVTRRGSLVTLADVLLADTATEMGAKVLRVVAALGDPAGFGAEVCSASSFIDLPPALMLAVATGLISLAEASIPSEAGFDQLDAGMSATRAYLAS